MRIVMVTDNFYPEIGGIQESIMLTSKTLGERGHQVLIVAPSASASDFEVVKLPVKEIDLGPSVRVERIFSFHIPSNTLQSRAVSPLMTSLPRILRFRPDVIHTQGFFGLGVEALWAKRILGIPLVGTNHWAIGEFNMYFPVSPERFARWSINAVTWYYNHCAFVSAPSDSVFAEMEPHGLRVPHGVLSNPIDTHIFQPVSRERKEELRRKLGFTGSTMIFAGRFGLEKRIDVLVRALGMLVKDIPEATLALAGHGSDRARLESMARELGVHDRLRFLGTLSKPDLAEAYQAADVFAIASTSETQCMALLQAMCCGLPGVAIDWRTFPEYLSQERGFVSPPGDAAAFAANLKKIFSDANLRERYGRNSQIYSTKFSAAGVAESWERVYETYRKH